MAKPEKTNAGAATAAEAAPESLLHPASVTDSDVAHRAYELYLARDSDTGTTWTIGPPLNANCERAPPPRDVAIARVVMPHHPMLNRVRVEYLEMPGCG